MKPGRQTRPSIVALAVVWAAVAVAPAVWAADCNAKELFKNAMSNEVTGCLGSNARDAAVRTPVDLMFDNPSFVGRYVLSCIEGGQHVLQPAFEAYEREDHAKACSLFEEIVSRNPFEVQVGAASGYLGLAHLDGLGEDQRACLAFFLFVNAAQSGFADAQYRVAVELFALALDGHDFDRIPAKILALALFIKSARQGHEQAITMRDVLQSVLTTQELAEAESLSLSFPYADVLRSIC